MNPEEAGGLDPVDLVVQIFRQRLGIPESEDLGAFFFLDQGRVRLVRFSA